MWAVLFQSSLSHSTRHVSISSKSATVSVHKNYIHHLTLVFCVEGRCPGPRPSQPSPASHRCWLKQVDCFNPAHLPRLLKDQTGAISLLPILGKLVPYKEDADFFPSIFISLPWQIFLTKKHTDVYLLLNWSSPWTARTKCCHSCQLHIFLIYLVRSSQRKAKFSVCSLRSSSPQLTPCLRLNVTHCYHAVAEAVAN